MKTKSPWRQWTESTSAQFLHLTIAWVQPVRQSTQTVFSDCFWLSDIQTTHIEHQFHVEIICTICAHPCYLCANCIFFSHRWHRKPQMVFVLSVRHLYFFWIIITSNITKILHCLFLFSQTKLQTKNKNADTFQMVTQHGNNAGINSGTGCWLSEKS